MEGKLRKSAKRSDFLRLLQFRETFGESGKLLQKNSQFTADFIKKLGLEHELEGHAGCVNCLQWTPDGRFLASGSDDTKVILWDPFRHKKLQLIPTTHIGNIFSVKFLGGRSNIIGTAAADGRVLVQAIDSTAQNKAPLLECTCHVNRVKRLAVSPEEPTLFWSAGEDGLVLEFDLREPHQCPSTRKALLDLTQISELKCIAVNPTKPHYLAVGANDCYIRMYDRRYLKPVPVDDNSFMGTTRPESEPVDPSIVQYYTPGHLAKEHAYVNNFRLATTYVSFNSSGSEMLVNIGGEQVYLFDVNNSRHINEMHLPPQNSTSRKKTYAYTCICHMEGNGMKKLNISSTNPEFAEENCACFYMRRAFKCQRRKWFGDLYSAARDYLYIIQTWPDHKHAYISLIKTLVEMKWDEAAATWLKYFKKVHPDYVESSHTKFLTESIDNLKNQPKQNGYGIKDRKLSDIESSLRLDSFDFERRFVGHCNTTTDIKEVNFLGDDGNYICAGSDEGVIFIWDKKTAEIVTALIGDSSIVNCIQPHPATCFIASSGIDPVIKLWAPKEDEISNNPHLVRDINGTVELNQQRMAMDPFDSILVNMGIRHRDVTLQDVPCRTC